MRAARFSESQVKEFITFLHQFSFYNTRVLVSLILKLFVAFYLLFSLSAPIKILCLSKTTMYTSDSSSFRSLTNIVIKNTTKERKNTKHKQ